jgi:hypothetical protein
MKPYSVSKLTSIVSILIVSFVGLQAMGQEMSEGAAKENNRNKAVERCQDAKKDLSTAVGEAVTVCQASKNVLKVLGNANDLKWSCGKAIEQCEEAETIDIPFLPSGINFGLDGGIGEDCDALGEMSQSEFRSNRREEERSLASAETELEKLEEKAPDIEKDYQESVKDIQALKLAFTEKLKTNKRESADAERKRAQEEKAAGDGLSAAILAQEKKILSLQHIQLKLPAERNIQIDSYKSRLLQCQLDLKIEAAKLKKETKILAGSLRRASIEGIKGGQLLADKWDQCVQEVLSRRTADGIVYQSNVEIMNADLNAAMVELSALKQSKAMFELQKNQIASESEANKLEDKQANLEEYNEIMRQQGAADSVNQKRIFANSLLMTKKNARVNKANNQVRKYADKYLPGTKTRTEALSMIAKVHTARQDCLTKCTLTPEAKSLNVNCDGPINNVGNIIDSKAAE